MSAVKKATKAAKCSSTMAPAPGDQGEGSNSTSHPFGDPATKSGEARELVASMRTPCGRIVPTCCARKEGARKAACTVSLEFAVTWKKQQVNPETWKHGSLHTHKRPSGPRADLLFLPARNQSRPWGLSIKSNPVTFAQRRGFT